MSRTKRQGHHHRTPSSLWISLVVGLALLTWIPGCGGGGGGDDSLAGPFTIAGGTTTDEFFSIVALARTEDDRLQVDYTLTDGGQPLSLGDLDGVPRFALAYIEEDASSGLTRYQGYRTTMVTGQNFQLGGMTQTPALTNAEQVTLDSGGTTVDLGGGTFRYTFGSPLPVGFDEEATHTLAGQATMGGRTIVANPNAHFVPSGGALTTLREVVTTEACNACHHQLSVHGGQRQDVTLCQTCHTSQTVDPESGRSLDFASLIHGIHYGAELSQPYFVVGFQQSTHDYSGIVFPQDSRNCTVCHRDGSEADHWRTAPNRAACGSCHDDVDFTTGANHNNIIQTSDDACGICHAETAAAEYDLSVPGAHVIPYYSLANPNLTLAITDVQNMLPGMQPTIRFTVTDNSGPLAITELNALRVTFGGSTSDYTHIIANDNRFTIRGGGSTPMLVTHAVGDYSYTPFRDAGMTTPYTVPMTATGTWAVGLEARTNARPAGPQNIQFGSNNPIVNIDLSNGGLGGGQPLARRVIVSEDKCNACHGDIVFHGNTRTELEYCVMCHNRWGTDESRRGTAADPMGPLHPVTNPPASIDFAYMIHKIHRGIGLENPYVVWGFGSPATAHDFSHVVFPGNIEACDHCHVNDSHLLPIANGTQATVINIAGTPTGTSGHILPPTTAACVSCHDGASTLAHAQANSVPIPPTDPFNWAESCDVCHGPTAPFAAHGLNR